MVLCITIKTVKTFTEKNSINVVANIFKKSVFSITEILIEFFLKRYYEAGELMLYLG